MCEKYEIMHGHIHKSNKMFVCILARIHVKPTLTCAYCIRSQTHINTCIHTHICVHTLSLYLCPSHSLSLSLFLFQSEGWSRLRDTHILTCTHACTLPYTRTHILSHVLCVCVSLSLSLNHRASQDGDSSHILSHTRRHTHAFSLSLSLSLFFSLSTRGLVFIESALTYAHTHS